MGGTTLSERDRPTEAPAVEAATAPDAAVEATAVPDHEPEPAGPPPHDDPPAPPGPRPVRPARPVLLAALLPAALGQTAVVPALPAIAGELSGGPAATWVVAVHILASALGLPLNGKLADHLGRKAGFLLALLVFTAGSALAGTAHSMSALVAYRAVQGFGAGGLMACVHAILAETAPPGARARRTAAAGVTYAAGLLAGPLVGGYCADHGAWRWCLTLNVPIGLLLLFVAAVAVRLPRPAARPRPDLAAAPLIPPHLLRATFAGPTGLVGAALALALYGAVRHLPSFLQAAGGTTATASGLLMLPLTGALVAAALTTGPLVRCTGHGTVLPILGCAAAAAGLWRLGELRPDAARPALGLWTGVLGLGLGLVLPVLVLAVRTAVPDPDPAGAVACLRRLAGTVGAGLAAALLAGHLVARLPASAPLLPVAAALPTALRDGYAAAATAVPRSSLFLAPVLVLGFLLALFRLALLWKRGPLMPHARQAPQAPPPPYDAPAAAAVPPARSAADTTAGSTDGGTVDATAGITLDSAVPGGSWATGRAAHATSSAAAAPNGPAASGVPVCGTVRHHDGSVVPRAALTLIDAAGRQVGRGATGEDGRYALSTPGAGGYVLIAAAGGHQPQAVAVAVGERPVELDVVLGGAGRLAGTVTTAGGAPVREAAVTLTDVRGEVVASTRSGREGTYVLGELVAGEYTLAASAPAFRPAALSVTVQASRETRQDVELAGGAVLRGTVRAGGGRPVEDARVTLLDAGGSVVDTATTGTDGLFRFVDLSAGEYTVIAAGYPPVATVLRLAGGGRTERDLQLGQDDD
ncbi:MFS transporter [Streptomyces sp. S186]|uniref:MFS transporter n=1 Tax=Streptomyces sp. S186 TaxID=3434395 RepID=UPI003F67E00C